MSKNSYVTKAERKLHNFIEVLDQKKRDNEEIEYTFYEKFRKPGKQGICGIMTIEKKMYCVFKISQYLDYLIEHERIIFDALNELRVYCPHYCKMLGQVETLVDPNFRKADNPFAAISKYPIKMNVILTEYIPGSKNLLSLIKNKKVKERVIYSSVKQVLMAIEIAQRKKRFTHYDLHSCNILMKKCDPDDVFLYNLPDSQVCVPTYGTYPVIIDYGFSYVGDMENKPFYGSLAHTEIGFIPSRFDSIADSKLFLVSLSDELKVERGSRDSRTFRRLVRNIFSPLKIDWECGWDKTRRDISAADHVSDILEELDTDDYSRLFSKYNHFCVDIIQSLITHPLRDRSSKGVFLESYAVLVEEFSKLEQEIGSSFYNLYLLRVIVNAARDVRSLYGKREKRKKAIRKFKIKILEEIVKISKFCYPTKINYEKLLCSLLLFSKNMEKILYDHVNNRVEEKQKQYDKMAITTPEDLYKVIETNIPDTYEYTSTTRVHIFDTVSEGYTFFKIPDKYLELVNETHPLVRGSLIYKLFQKGKSSSSSSEESEYKSESENDTEPSNDDEKDSNLEDEEGNEEDEEGNEEDEEGSEEDKEDEEGSEEDKEGSEEDEEGSEEDEEGSEEDSKKGSEEDKEGSEELEEENITEKNSESSEIHFATFSDNEWGG